MWYLWCKLNLLKIVSKLENSNKELISVIKKLSKEQDELMKKLSSRINPDKRCLNLDQSKSNPFDFDQECLDNAKRIKLEDQTEEIVKLKNEIGKTTEENIKIVTDNVRLTHEVDELKRKLLAFEQSESK